MEIIRKYFKLNIKKQVGLWSWIGRVAPLSALLVLSLILYYDIDTWLKTVLVLIGLIFSITAFTWWWWVIGAVKALTDLLTSAQTRFGEVLTEIKDLRKDMNDKNKKK